MKKIKLGFIGYGNMAKAIVKAVERDIIDKFEICIYDPLYCETNDKILVAKSNQQLVSFADFVVLAIKPQVANEVLRDVRFNDNTIISIMAGVTIDRLIKLTGANKIVRVMPNLNARVGKSFNAYATYGIDEKLESEVVALLSSFGTPCKVTEDKLNAITGLTGSSPAFVFMFIKAIYDVALTQGFSEETARTMAISTVLGSAETVKSCDVPLDELIKSVCSKGGTTIEGVNHLINQGFEELISQAVNKAIKRAEEL